MTAEMRKIKLKKWLKRSMKAMNVFYAVLWLVLVLIFITNTNERNQSKKNLPIGDCITLQYLLPGKTFTRKYEVVNKADNEILATYDISFDIGEDGSINSDYVDGVIYDPATETVSCRVYVCGSAEDASLLKQALKIQIKTAHVELKCIFAFMVLVFIGFCKVITWGCKN